MDSPWEPSLKQLDHELRLHPIDGWAMHQKPRDAKAFASLAVLSDCLEDHGLCLHAEAIRLLVAQGTFAFVVTEEVVSQDLDTPDFIMRHERFQAKVHAQLSGDGPTVRDCLNNYIRRWLKRFHRHHLDKQELI